MTIGHEFEWAIRTIAPKAREFSGMKNPYISLKDLESVCQGDEILNECLKDLVHTSIRYAEVVIRFEMVKLKGQKSNEDGSREEIEFLRTAVHDAVIASTNVFSRAMKLRKGENTWIQIVSRDRASYMAFALRIAFDAALRKED